MKRPLRILVLTYWSYKDALIKSYTLPYLPFIRAAAGGNAEIWLMTLENPAMATTPSERTEIRAAFAKQDITWLPYKYRPFGLRMGFHLAWYLARLTWLIWRKRIDVIHGFCTPAGGLGYFLSKLTGKPLVVDSFEPHAESMVETGTWEPGSFAFRILFAMERWQTRHASAIIGCVRKMEDYAELKYGIRPVNMQVKPACVDMEKFNLDLAKDPELVARFGLEGKIVAFYAGKFGDLYLEDEVFRFLKVAYNFWGDRFRLFALTGNSPEYLHRLRERAGLPEQSCIFHPYVDHSEVPRYAGLGDFALTPTKPVPSKRYCTPIKTGEYWAMGMPVVITPGISDDSDIIESSHAGVIMDPMHPEAYPEAVAEMDEILRTSDRTKIRAMAAKYRNFTIAIEAYDKVYGELVDNIRGKKQAL